VIKIIRRNTGAPRVGTSLETKRPLAVRQREQQELITREVELLRRLLPGCQWQFAEDVHLLAEMVLDEPRGAKKWKFWLRPELPQIHAGLIHHLVSGDSGGWTSQYAPTELTIRTTGPKAYDILAGYSGQRYDRRSVVDLGILDDPDYWDRAWVRWRNDLLIDPDAGEHVHWDANLYLDDIESSVFRLREKLVRFRADGERSESLTRDSFNPAVPASLFRILMSDSGHRQSWPGDDMPLLHILNINGRKSPLIALSLSDMGRFVPDPQRALSSWERFLDKDRWMHCYRRWACLE